VAIKKVDTVIDGHAIQVVQFAGVRGLTIKARLYKLLLPAVGALLGGNAQAAPPQSLSMLQEMDLEAAFMRLAESVEPESFTKFMLDLLSSTFIDGRMIDEACFNDVFAGNYMLAYKIAIEAIKANGFFDFGAIGPLLQKIGPMGQPISSKESPTA
jgi:hypothetical protein